MAKVIGKKPAIKAEEEVTLVGVNADTVSVRIKKSGPYGVWGIDIGRTVAVGENDPNELIDELIGDLDAIASGYAEQFPAVETVGECCSSSDAEPLEPEEVNNVEPDDSGDGVTEEDIRGMDKKELVKFIKEMELDIDPKEYKKVGDLADAVIEALSEEQSEPEPEVDDSNEAVSEEDIRNMSKKELLEFIKENDIDIDPKEYKKFSELVDAVVELINSEPGDEITPDAIRDMGRTELIDLIDEQELEVKAKDYKKTSELAEAIIAEMFDESTGADDFDNFDSTDFNEE